MSGTVLAALAAQAAPLAACLLILIALRRRKAAAAATAILAMSVSLLASARLVLQVAIPDAPALHEATWLPVESGGGLAFGVLLDPLSTTMALVVAVITLAVMVYSVGYMKEDPGFARYFGFLALFGWAMQGLVLSSNLLQTLVFWELVGLASFLLIGFWYERPEPAAAARKAFIMTRVGDVGFLFGVLYLVSALGYSTIPVLNVAAAGGALTGQQATIAAGLILMGAIGKSAQGPLFTWLPDAMEGPTPVSALLHSATMVAAGVFLVARLHPLFLAAPQVMEWLLWIALVTAVATATMAMVANDIKRVLAYSSISQLGYMFMGLAAGSLAAGYFHLVTHAGFKALLFLASGIFIHHAHSNDMRAIALKDPRSQKAGVIGLVAGSAALAGVIPFSGYFSKEAVLGALHHAGTPVLVLAYLGAGLTAYYTFRMVFLTLALPKHPDDATLAEPHLPHGSAWMAVPVVVLAALTLVLGYLGGFLAHRLGPVELAEHGPFTFGTGPATALALVAAGIALAWVEFGRRGAARIGFAERLPAVRDFLGSNWYVDRLYGATVVRLANALSRAAKWNDHTVLDGASDVVANGTVGSGRILSLLQTGSVQVYVATAVTLVAALAAWMTAGGAP
jgi:NADH-quinone oxidoreductase subunit L